MSQPERRADKRFPIRLGLRYRVLNRRAPKVFRHGTTVNMASHGIVFVYDHTLSVGTYVEAHIHWPVKSEGKLPMKLVLPEARVVRSESGRIALAFRRHQFRVYQSDDV